MILNNIEEILCSIKSEVQIKLEELKSKELKISWKEDKSILTEMDLYISDLVKSEFKEKYPAINFYSEEDQESTNYPVIILDPIDGTKEFAEGIGECAISLAVMYSEKLDDDRNFGWLYNPFTGFEVNSKFVKKHDFEYFEKLSCLVSRTEYSNGHYRDNRFDEFNVVPRGSIAFKLGLLSIGATDFIISLRNKNVWDIAAGTIILKKCGVSIFENGKKLETLPIREYQSELIWCVDKLKERI